jgi:hypothetical protein
VWLEYDADVRAARLVAQEIAPGRGTSKTRRVLVHGLFNEFPESLGVSPDGRRLVVSMFHASSNLEVVDGFAIRFLRNLGARPTVRAFALVTWRLSPKHLALQLNDSAELVLARIASVRVTWRFARSRSMAAAQPSSRLKRSSRP